jgi:hypothetical protein
MNSPFILGTVLNGGFERKLRMLRCDLFGLLMVSESTRFISTTKQGDYIKRGVLKLTEKGQAGADSKEGIVSRSKGWNKILHHKFEDN